MPKIIDLLNKKRKLNELENEESLDSKSNILRKKRKLDYPKKIKINKFILLKSGKQNWFWEGSNILIKDNIEEPLILELDKKNFYFYSNGIQKNNNNSKLDLISFIKNSDLENQKKVIDKFEKIIKQNNPYHQEILLKLKLDLLTNQIETWIQDINNEKKYLTEKNNPHLKSIEDLNTIFNGFQNIKKKFKNKYYYLRNYLNKKLNLDNFNQFNEVIKNPYFQDLSEKIKRENKEIDNLNQLTIDLKKEVEDIKKSLENDSQYLIKRKEIEDANALKLKKLENKKIEKKEILLNYENKEALIWNGITLIDEESNEEPLSLKIRGKTFYFYSSEIQEERKKWNTKSTFFNSLNIDNKKQIVETFNKVIDENNLYQKSVLIKLKNKLLNNKIKNLNKIFKNEKNSLNDPNNKDLNIIINNIKNQKDLITNKIGFLIKNAKKNDEKSEYVKKNLEKITQEIEDCNEKINILSNNSIDLSTRIDSLIEKFPQINLKNLNKIILLKTRNQEKKLHTIWKGATLVNEEEQKEKPFILELDKEKFYFYSNGIETYTKKNNNEGISYENQLDFQTKEKIKNAFSEKIDQNNLWHQIILLDLKIDFFHDLVKELNKKNHEQKPYISSNEKYKSFLSELKNLNKKTFWLKNSFNQIIPESNLENLITNEENMIIEPSKILLEKSDTLNKNYWLEIIKNQNQKLEFLEEQRQNLINNFEILLKESIEAIWLNQFNLYNYINLNPGTSGLDKRHENYSRIEENEISNNSYSSDNKLIIDLDFEKNDDESEKKDENYLTIQENEISNNSYSSDNKLIIDLDFEKNDNEELEL